jgi:hypothetical protein
VKLNLTNQHTRKLLTNLVTNTYLENEEVASILTLLGIPTKHFQRKLYEGTTEERTIQTFQLSFDENNIRSLADLAIDEYVV